MELVKERTKPRKPKKKTESKKSSECIDKKVVECEVKEHDLKTEFESIQESSSFNHVEVGVEIATESLDDNHLIKDVPVNNISKSSPDETQVQESSQCLENVISDSLKDQNITKTSDLATRLVTESDAKVQSIYPSTVPKSSAEVAQNKFYPDLKVSLIDEQVETKTKSVSEKTIIKSVYPDLRSIQYCEKVEDITSIQTLVRTHTEEYLHKTCIEATKRLHEFHMVLADINRYPIFDLIKEYQNARKRSTDAQNRLKFLNSKLNILKNELWKIVKKEASSKGRCGDGYNISISHSYYIKELDEKVFNEVIEILRELEEIILSNTYYSYSDQLSKFKIEQYIYNMNFKEILQMTGHDITSGNCSMKIDILKKCISIIFHYQRQSTTDKEFLEICQKWLKYMVYILLQNGTHTDYAFLLNHVIRCPNGIKTWAVQFIKLPVSAYCLKEDDSFNCQCIYYALLVLYLILTPVPDREIFLKNVKGDHSSTESGDGFTLLDSDGEEEENFEIVKNWTNEDFMSLLSQVPIAKMFEHILIENTNGTMNIKPPTKEKVLKMFAFSTSLVNILFNGLESYCSKEYSETVAYICSMIRNIVCYVSDDWIYCLNLDIPSKSALQSEYDRFMFHVIYKLFHFQKFGVWKFLSMLPYRCTSKKMLWQILWIFHSQQTGEDDAYFTKDVDLKLQDQQVISEFIQKLKSVEQSDQMFLLNVYQSIVLSGTCEKDFLSFVVHEIFEVAFVETSLHQLSKESTSVLTSIIKKYPNLLSRLLDEAQSNEDDVLNFTLPMYENLSLTQWMPTKEDITILTDWLLTTELSSPKNYLARILLTKMNWGFSENGNTVLPIQLHQEIAVLVLQAYMKFDNKANEWSVSNGLAQMLQFATLRGFSRESEGFVPWAWDLLFTLKLHALDAKYPPWFQIYEGTLKPEFFLDPFKEMWLQPLLKGYEERHPVACYLFLVMTEVGHNVRKLMTEGIKCLTALIEHQQYLAAIHSLFYILPFFVKCSEELISQGQFIRVVSDLIVADMTVLSSITGAVVGAVLHKIVSMIKHQVTVTSAITVECAAPLLKLWINILLKVLSVQEEYNYKLRDSAKQVHFLLDLIVKISSMDSYTRENMIDFLFSFGNPLLTLNSKSTSYWGKLFSPNVDCYTILKKQTLPEFPWLAWFIIRSETKQKHMQDLWYQVQKEMNLNTDISPIIALKKSSSFLKITQPPLESLPVYRWGLQILETDKKHPVQPLLWQQFFYYYFERVSSSESQLPKCLAKRYFKSGKNVEFLKKLQMLAQEIAEFYRKSLKTPKDSSPSNTEASAPAFEEIDTKLTTKGNFINFELCKMFRAFSLWIDDQSLLSPNLCFSALDPKYCCERLKLILDKDQTDWFDLISFEQLRDDLDQKVHAWERKRKSVSNEDSVIQVDELSLCLRITKHLNCNQPQSLVDDVIIDPPIREIEDFALSSWRVLVELIESNQNIIIDKAKSFTELASRLKQLNVNYKNWVPQEYYNEKYWETRTKSCHKGLNCGEPASFRLELQKYLTNQRIREKIESNRIDHHMVQNQLFNLPVDQLCIASVKIENYIRALHAKLQSAKGEESNKYRNLGVGLFYHQIEKVNRVISSVRSYAPSRNFFSTSIESLGNVFIHDQETELCKLASTVLTYPEAGELAFDLFNPNVASIEVFLNLYQVITSSINRSPPNSIFVLLNKIDIQRILNEKGTRFCDRRKLFNQICTSLKECTSNPPQELLMVHEVLRKHFCVTLEWSFPELYEDAVVFLLEGMQTNSISINVWYNLFKCFGCSTLNAKSSISEIDSSLKKLAENLLLSPDQQMYVSSKPINISEVMGTLDRLYKKFMEFRKTQNIYEAYKEHVKPFGIFISLLSHSMLALLNENTNYKQVMNISKLWEGLHLSFYPWLHPLKLGTRFQFPWTDDHIQDARFMFQLFTLCLNNFNEKLFGFNCEKSILSYLWSSYVDVYVSSDIRHYSVAVCHSELLHLPWEQFHPDSKDLEGMCSVLQSNLPESKEFLTKISLKIPWIEVMKNISATKSPDYIRKTLSTLGKLLIVSGLDISLTKSNVHQNNLKALEELSWHFLSLEDTEVLLDLYYSTFDSSTLLKEEVQENPDIYILKFLKLVCCMTIVPNFLESKDSNPKRLLYLRKYVTALTKTELSAKDSSRIKLLLPSLLTDIEHIICKVVHPDQQISAALPLIRETLGFLNNIPDSNLESSVINSVISYLKDHPRSVLLLPCLQTACKCLNQMTSAVMIVECCITTRFNTGLQDPSEAQNIWQLILSYFEVPISMTDEFILASVNKNAFLTLYCYVLDRMPKTAPDGKKLLLNNLIEWIQSCDVSNFFSK
ncbi:hypothetical protein JTE90_029615 [Oedothorax gibbosus]|uniref:Ectopic P granules protein 5 homolog n=1 Tax=Oedothorax gibbosus TaxID=931172 RepID=A0AAV6VH87_9ARAC|nr:hypothetical protein JTE90_029615 [Oedothorax gibbosus]